MTNRELISKIEEFVWKQPGNFVSKEDALSEELEGMRIYDAPLVGFASAEDELFTKEFKKEGVIHPDYLSPREWLPQARTVISVFLPFTEEVRSSNRTWSEGRPGAFVNQRCSSRWLHGRIEGQTFINQLTDYMQSLLEREGYQTVCPTTSGKHRKILPYVSNWSERHAAYAAGLGTFGLSKGLITKKGMAGRFGSIITDAEFLVTKREYSSPFEYCAMCGACMRRCPVQAIDIGKGCALGKNQDICGDYIERSKLPPHGANKIIRYGCGQCQVSVPCEHGIPAKRPGSQNRGEETGRQ